MSQCQVHGCESAVKGKGFCGRHLHKFTRYGDPTGGCKTRNGEALEWINRVIRDAGKDDCALWPFPDGGAGYGTFKVAGRRIRANRYACEALRGPPPSPKHEAAHECGRSLCCNPHHLTWKLHVENLADKYAHGTALLGEKHHQAKLTEPLVREIRTLRRKMTRKEIAAQYGVGRSTVDNIIDRRTWRHV